MDGKPMSGDDPRENEKASGIRGFLTSFFTAVARDLFQLLIAFSIVTGAAAVVCWYYGVPLFLSLLGGILVLGFALALKSDSLFD
jgi:hypothetical protein